MEESKGSTMHKEDTSSATVSIETIFFSATIHAHEHTDIATTNIPGAFMQAVEKFMLNLR